MIDKNKVKGVVAKWDVWGWVQDGVADHGKKAAVKGHVQDGFPQLDGFHRSLPEPFCSSLDCGTIPVDAVVCLLNRNYNAILGVSSSHCLCVLTQSDFQCPLCSFTYREPRTQLLSTAAAGTCSSLALGLS